MVRLQGKSSQWKIVWKYFEFDNITFFRRRSFFAFASDKSSSLTRVPLLHMWEWLFITATDIFTMQSCLWWLFAVSWCKGILQVEELFQSTIDDVQSSIDENSQVINGELSSIRNFIRWKSDCRGRTIFQWCVTFIKSFKSMSWATPSAAHIRRAVALVLFTKWNW